MKAQGVIEGIFTYPVKSCRWRSHKEVLVNEMGLQGDRQYMLVDESGKFLTQRQIPFLSKIVITTSGDTIGFILDGEETKLELNDRQLFQKPVTVWNDSLDGAIEYPGISSWLSHKLNQNVCFVKRPDSKDARTKFIAKTNETINLNLVDGYPVHLVNIASVKDLESRVGTPLSPMRFRPNFLISGLKAYEEEMVDTVTAGDFTLQIIKPSGRCAIPNIDPDHQSIGKEPMRTLASYKNSGNNVTFGIYATVSKTGKALLGEDLSFKFSG